ncbi:Creatinase/aminopeptidase [Tilletiaria anomala UBC 951]|uniref:Creatinase/aminopeptidase n=1 Tax=Tilletiaria anomala (strain ATCC 24038 / CBS 436.72 / UBC 951) TaxID=1037660 RepID=A0A066W2Q0_TILAU|nr:Creatinase/aminopeptidase [Tilletiaria anomala UBC 951]KDN46818.1 Creatinase/aminopeptidase [Tilletiaria anomala UBC 951]
MSCFSFLRRLSKLDVASDASSMQSASTLVGHVDDARQDEKASAVRPCGDARGRFAPTPTTKQLSVLRDEMHKEGGLAWYIVSSDDEHASEYTAPPDQRRAFITGFTASAGTAIVGTDEAHAFADGRYWVQAEQQLDCNWTLHKVGMSGTDNWDAFLLKAVKPGDKVGFDAKTISYKPAKALIAALKQAGAEVSLPTRNLVDAAWPDRPEPKLVPVHEHPLKFSGKHASEKLADLHKWNQAQPAADQRGITYLISALDEVAWTLNLRGDAIPNNPVFPAYLTITSLPGEQHPFTTLYISSDLVPHGSDVYHYISSLGVRILEHDAIWSSLSASTSATTTTISISAIGDNILVATEKVSWAIVEAFAGGEENMCVLGPQSPSAMAKAVKNDVEIQGFRNAYLRDGAAWCIWAAHLDHDIRCRGKQVDEWTAAVRLDKERQPLKYYAGESYEPISATGQNAALPHYETPATGSDVINTTTPYLCDYGAQYLDGTIDTTRTVFFGQRPSKEHTRAFTRVLQGHIAIDRAVFPAGSTGAMLDVLARKALWQDGMNYSHGTGHGIGAYLGVHEGPHGFSTSSGGSKVPVALQPGMMLSNEPGFYEEGHYGIRTESIICVKEVDTRRNFGGTKWYGFERITQVPIDRRLVDFSLLSKDEVGWLHKHNEDVKRNVLPLIKHDRLATRWLSRQ